MEKVFQTYNGGKDGNGTYQNIINHIPKCDRFIEVFAGNCAITRKIKKPGITVINDYDSSVYERLKALETQNVLVTNRCYSDIIVSYDCKDHKTFFYCDPPYLFSTRKSQQRLYNYEFSDSDHFKFLELANTVKSNCMISHYPCDLYDNALKGWRTFDFESCTRNGMRTERIYMNYAQPKILQDYRYLGKDFIERQQIKRKTERLLNRLERLPELERTALLSAIIGKYNYASATILQTPQ